MTDAQDPTDRQVLLVDDHSGPLPPIPFGVEIEANFTITYLASVPMGGGAFMHNYNISGTFSFLDELGNTLLSGTVPGASMSAAGNALSWFTTARIEGEAMYTWFGGAIPAYDLAPGTSMGSGEFAFALTSVNLEGLDAPLDPDTHLPAPNWVSEGSFTGNSRFIPVPTTAAALGLGFLVALRRRRG